MKKVKLVLIGAGDRGTTYADLGFDHCPEMELVAASDPNPVRRNRNFHKRSKHHRNDACFLFKINKRLRLSRYFVSIHAAILLSSVQSFPAEE